MLPLDGSMAAAHGGALYMQQKRLGHYLTYLPGEWVRGSIAWRQSPWAGERLLGICLGIGFGHCFCYNHTQVKVEVANNTLTCIRRDEIGCVFRMGKCENAQSEWWCKAGCG